MRGLMTEENLVGRVVGVGVEHPLDPSQYVEGQPSVIERTEWLRIGRAALFDPFETDPSGYDATNIHTGEDSFVLVGDIHTVMPRSY